MTTMASPALTPEMFKQLYFEQGQSLEQLAKRYGYSRTKFHELVVDEWGFTPTRRRPKPAGDLQPLTYELLHELRAERKMSRNEIAELLGHSPKRVMAALRRHGLAYDYHASLAGRLGTGELWFLHHEQGLSAEAIATRFASSATLIINRMREVGVELIPRHTTRAPKPVRPKSIPKPNLQLLDDLDFEVAARPRHTKPRAIDEVGAAELRRLHHDEKMPIRKMAAHYGTAPRFVIEAMNAHGIEIRLRRGGAGARQSAEETVRADELRKRADVKKVLRRHRVDDASLPVRDLSRELMRELYVDCGLAAVEVALLCQRTAVAITRALRLYQIPLRPAHLPRPNRPVKRTLTKASFESQLAKGKSLEEIAKLYGYSSAASLKVVAQVLQVRLPGQESPKLPSALMREIKAAGITSEHGEAILIDGHRGRGSFSNIPPWPGKPGPALIAYLFGDLGLSKDEITERMHADWLVIKRAFEDAGISSERYERPEPFSRWKFDLEELKRLANEKDLPATAIAEDLGVSAPVVLRQLHRMHLPVRANKGDYKRVRFDELTADRRVPAAMNKAKVPLAGIDPPARGPLPAKLVKQLIDDFGLRWFDVELLTGRLANAVKRDHQTAGA